jgi:phospholipase C
MRGFRVPTILVSPFVKRGAVSSRIYDHASILRLIESRWSLQPLTIRDAQANNLADELDLQNPRLDAPAIEVTGAPFGHVCT